VELQPVHLPADSVLSAQGSLPAVALASVPLLRWIEATNDSALPVPEVTSLLSGSLENPLYRVSR